MSRPPSRIQASTDRSPEPTAGLVRSLNLQAVLEAIVDAGELSRPEVAALTGLSLPTAASLIADLETLGLVDHKGQSIGAPGRPAAIYSFNERAGYVFAVDLGARKVTACVSDLHGSILLEATEATRRTDPSSIADQIAEMHRDLTVRSGFKSDEPGIASVGVGGIVQPEDRSLREPNLPELQEDGFLRSLESALGIPALIENDVNLAAIGEKWKGRARGLTNFVVMSVGSGTGMGIVVDGEIYRGATGAAGEIAWLPIGPESTSWEGEDGGLFEFTTAGTGILRRRDLAIAADKDPSLSTLSDVEDIFAAARDHVPSAQEILGFEAEQLALGVVAAAALLDPEMVVFTGGIGSREILVDSVRDRVSLMMPSHPPIVVSQLGTRGTIYGAIAVALKPVRDQILTRSATGQ